MRAEITRPSQLSAVRGFDNVTRKLPPDQIVHNLEMLHQVAALAVMLVAQKGAATVPYQNSECDVIFEMPREWNPTRPKKKKEVTTAYIPLLSGGTAKIQFFSAGFTGEPQTWQDVQKDVNTQLKREISQQWQEDILGVPMLMTRVTYSDEGRDKIGLIGLLYSKTAKKLLIRMESPKEGYSYAQDQLKQALQTLRTFKNTPLAAEEPFRKITDEEAKAARKQEPTHSLIISGDAPKIKRYGPGSPVTISGKSATIYVPKGWTAKIDKDQCEFAKGDFKVHGVFGSALDGESGSANLGKAWAKSLDLFETVEHRVDTDKTTDAGLAISTVRRNGKDLAKKPLWYCDGVAQNGDFYLLVNAQGKFDQQKLLDDLLEHLGLDVSL